MTFRLDDPEGNLPQITRPDVRRRYAKMEGLHQKDQISSSRHAVRRRLVAAARTRQGKDTEGQEG
jgi:hypothetical protein